MLLSLLATLALRAIGKADVQTQSVCGEAKKSNKVISE
ncbi:hypothetical protein F543_14430 [Bibersteinia trehalosi USDA-ARS-USMARC-189]|uniref:Uncharacterized protein n=1 Tax=Bibersteinia trehalosi USDA-ARS-USMARC-189 TaxID=1263831 RepID=A0ABM5PEM7_BIBTR|nr:hypothetical protein F543_14430 [Bibersteinia trehalosi USDA-ARS-USMARC-189]